VKTYQNRTVWRYKVKSDMAICKSLNEAPSLLEFDMRPIPLVCKFNILWRSRSEERAITLRGLTIKPA